MGDEHNQPQLTRRSFGVRAIGGLAALTGVAGCAAVPTALRPETEPPRTRRIGLDLWVGDPVALTGAPFSLEQGSRIMRGPVPWRHPITGEVLQTYERINRERQGMKVQRFVIRPDGQALGRVFDTRPGRADRIFVNDAFFPLGDWAVAERRTFEMVEYSEGRAQTFTATLRMRRLSFTYRDVPDTLRYDWLLHDTAGTKIFDERFEYSPNIGFVNFTNRMSS